MKRKIRKENPYVAKGDNTKLFYFSMGFDRNFFSCNHKLVLTWNWVQMYAPPVIKNVLTQKVNLRGPWLIAAQGYWQRKCKSSLGLTHSTQATHNSWKTGLMVSKDIIQNYKLQYKTKHHDWGMTNSTSKLPSASDRLRSA